MGFETTVRTVGLSAGGLSSVREPGRAKCFRAALALVLKNRTAPLPISPRPSQPLGARASRFCLVALARLKARRAFLFRCGTSARAESFIRAAATWMTPNEARVLFSRRARAFFRARNTGAGARFAGIQRNGRLRGCLNPLAFQARVVFHEMLVIAAIKEVSWHIGFRHQNATSGSFRCR